MDLPERYEFDFVASSSIRIMPLKRDFDLFLRIDFSTIFASVDALMWFAFACMSNDCSPLPNITSESFTLAPEPFRLYAMRYLESMVPKSPRYQFAVESDAMFVLRVEKFTEDSSII